MSGGKAGGQAVQTRQDSKSRGVVIAVPLPQVKEEKVGHVGAGRGTGHFEIVLDAAQMGFNGFGDGKGPRLTLGKPIGQVARSRGDGFGDPEMGNHVRRQHGPLISPCRQSTQTFDRHGGNEGNDFVSVHGAGAGPHRYQVVTSAPLQLIFCSEHSGLAGSRKNGSWRSQSDTLRQRNPSRPVLLASPVPIRFDSVLSLLTAIVPTSPVVVDKRPPPHVEARRHVTHFRDCAKGVVGGDPHHFILSQFSSAFKQEPVWETTTQTAKTPSSSLQVRKHTLRNFVNRVVDRGHRLVHPIGKWTDDDVGHEGSDKPDKDCTSTDRQHPVCQ